MGLLRVASAMSLCAVAFSVQAEQLPIEVLSAVVKDQKIADAEVLLQRNGAQNVVGRTNAQGQVTLTSEAADDASNLLIIKKPGYSNLVVKCPCKGMTYAISPVMENLDGLRVVLTWGKAPRDLDSHMIFPGNNIFFNNKRAPTPNWTWMTPIAMARRPSPCRKALRRKLRLCRARLFQQRLSHLQRVVQQ